MSFQNNKLNMSKKMEPAFFFNGFHNWTKAIKCFSEHEKSDGHSESVYKLSTEQQPCVNEMLSEKENEDQKRHRLMLLKRLSTLRMLLRQGLPIRGHKEDDGNLKQLLKLRSEDCPGHGKWLKANDYLSPVIINEQITPTENNLFRKLLSKLHSTKWFAIMADESRDVVNIEQLSISIRWVDDGLDIQEDFSGLIQLPAIDANTMTTAIKDVLLQSSLH